MRFLFINLSDLQLIGTIPTVGTPLNLMLRKDLGDELLGVFLKKGGQLDDVYVVVRAKPDRVGAIREALDTLGRLRIKRRVRAHVRKRPPEPKTWKKVAR